ncbi:MAG: hypothetical protein HZA51_00585 [Planctomycetes bacterium]|nr:hypothetical protein [Planctomycetota bacterium]
MFQQVVAVILVFGPIGEMPEIPKVLREAFLSREKQSTCVLRYILSMENDAHKIKWEQRWEERWSGHNVLSVNHGSRDGIVSIRNGSQPGIGSGLACAPRWFLTRDREADNWMWSQDEDTAGVSKSRLNSRLDGRIVGLLPAWLPDSTPSRALEFLHEKVSPGSKWQVNDSDARITVTCIIPKGDSVIEPEKWEWHLDKERGNSIVLATWETVPESGTALPAARVETTYSQVDGRWWPQFSKTDTGGMRFTVETESVSFDRQDHAKKIGLESFGWPPGVRIAAKPNMGWKQGEDRYWTGSEVVTEEVWKSVPRDESAFKAMLARAAGSGHYAYPAWWNENDGTFGVKNVSSSPSEWEAFVRRWCLFHSADEKQVQAAYAILKRSQSNAFDEIKKIKEPGRITFRPANPDGGDDRTKAMEAETIKQIERGSIKFIFEDMKKRLNGLLTGEQSHKADAKSKDR